MIVYEDKNILVINKPAGLLVHNPVTRYGLRAPSIVDWLLKKYPEIKGVGEDPLRPGIVHRLDKDTSGVMIIAKNQPTFEYLKKQFKEREVKKTYIALVVGNLNPPAGGKKGVIDLPIGRSKKSPLQRIAVKPRITTRRMRGKLREAITEYKVLESFDIEKKYTLVEAYPKTGRTHQIRAHFKAIGHPLVCDKLYAKKLKCPFGLSHHFLHAYSLELILPDRSRSRFEADLPDDLEKVLSELRKI